jgi:DNA-binding MarR family transcriptional regulator
MEETELESMIGPRIQRLAKHSHRYLEQMPSFKRIEKVTGTKAWIIGFLAQKKDCDIYQRDFEKTFGISRSAACKLIDRMEEGGLIHRENVPGDARLKRLVLTEQAVRMNEQIEQELSAFNELLVKGFSEEELGQLRGYLERMERNVTGERAEKRCGSRTAV